ncbi:MAG TPA: diguanylate cyclase [Bryobacteraceae bacterium]|nr:diguanylate cyclase [Bryobacteraceae bacterium]
MWPEIIAAGSLVAALASTSVLLTTRRRLGESVREIEDLANSSLVIEEERKMLELIASGAALNEVLNTLTLAIERISPGAVCTIMLLDEEHWQYLSVVSGPSLPQVYLQALRGLAIGPDVGACGTAAFRNETTVVEDIATDYRFADARDFVLSHGLRSCWSQPICGSRNNVLGTFAMYHRHIAKPRSEELRMARAAAQLAGNAIERLRAEQALGETSRRLSLAERVARFGVWEANFERSTMTISEGTAAILELPADKGYLPVEEFDAMVHTEDLAALRAAADPSRAHSETVQNEFRVMLPSGAVRWIRSVWRFDLSERLPKRATGAMIDITEEKRMLAQSQEGRAAAENSARAARQAERLEQDRKAILELVAKDQPLDHIVKTIAQAVASHLPGSLCSIQIELADAPRISSYPNFPDRMASVLDQIPIGALCATRSSEPVANLSSDPGWLRLTAESLLCQRYRAVPILRDSRPTGMIISFFDEDCPDGHAEQKLLESWGQFASLAVERRGLYEQLSFRAQYDSLTGLLNRAALYDRLDAQLARTSEEGGELAVIYLDLDHFKEINDRYGHAAGDKVLQSVSRSIRANIRHTDIAARIGGDEFIVILPGVGDSREAGRIADLAIQAITTADSGNGRDLIVGASYGISIYPDNGVDMDALLTVADEEMYRAKLTRRVPRSTRVPASVLISA